MRHPSRTATAKTLAPAHETAYVLWREKALEVMPYLAPIMYGFVPLDAPGLQTMACDKGMRLYIDMEYALTHRDAQWAIDGLLHECGHIIGRHFDRSMFLDEGGPASDSRLWNIAGDASINPMLIEAGCVSLATGEDVVPSMFAQPDHMSPEHYYEVLKNLRNKSQSGDSGDGEGEGGAGDDSLPFSGCGSISGGQPAPCEVASDGGSLGSEYSAASPEELSLAIEEAAAAAQQYASSGRGTVPADMAKMFEVATVKPAADWRSLVHARASRAVKNGMRNRADVTKVDKRRRNVYVGGKRVLYPGTRRMSPLGIVIRDTSGSTSEVMPRISGHILDISRRLGISKENFLLIDVDSRAFDPIPMKGNMTLRSVNGLGGTDLRVGFDKIAELGLNPDVVFVLSDLETPWPHQQQWPTIIVGVGDLDDRAVSGVPSWAQFVRAE